MKGTERKGKGYRKKKSKRVLINSEELRRENTGIRGRNAISN